MYREFELNESLRFFEKNLTGFPSSKRSQSKCTHFFVMHIFFSVSASSVLILCQSTSGDAPSPVLSELPAPTQNIPAHTPVSHTLLPPPPPGTLVFFLKPRWTLTCLCPTLAVMDTDLEQKRLFASLFTLVFLPDGYFRGC